MATSLVNKNWIFICPVILYHNPLFIKTFYLCELQMNNYYGEIITEYLTNYMCFIVLSVEIFSILFTFGAVKKCCCTAICEYDSFFWIVSGWFGKNGFEKEKNFMIQISNP